MSAPLPSAGQAAYVYKPVPSSFQDEGYYDGNGPQAMAVPVQSPAPVYYGTWRDDMGQVEVVHRADDWDLVWSLCIVLSFFPFLAFVILIVVLSIEYNDDDYSRRLLDIVLGKITDQF